VVEPGTHWHTLTTGETFERLKSSPHGLAAAEVANRLDEFGPNELQAAGRVSPWAILLEQFKNVLIIILLLATALSAFLGQGVEAIAITVIVLFAVILGFIRFARARVDEVDGATWMVR
jgi:Ca2+-transporting ATPase